MKNAITKFQLFTQTLLRRSSIFLVFVKIDSVTQKREKSKRHLSI